MLLDHLQCDRCGHEAGPFGPEDIPDNFITVVEPCEVHGVHEYHYCGWECAMHACAAHLERVEAHENVEED